MTVDRAVFALAGVMVLLSLALGYFVSQYWFLLTALPASTCSTGHRHLPGQELSALDGLKSHPAGSSQPIPPE
jgi:hypothetical protein